MRSLTLQVDFEAEPLAELAILIMAPIGLCLPVSTYTEILYVCKSKKKTENYSENLFTDE